MNKSDEIKAPTAIILFAKAPVDGYVKTRLSPYLAAEEILQLHRLLVVHSIRMAQLIPHTDLILYGAPDSSHTFFQSLQAEYCIRLRNQSEGDLGMRMCHALTQTLSCYQKALLVGTDLPDLKAQHFLDAEVKLESGADLVYAPTQDGGFGLVGMADCPAGLFAQIPWGSSEVMQASRQTAHKLDLKLAEVAALRDLDTPDDYLYYQEDIENYKKIYLI